MEKELSLLHHNGVSSKSESRHQGDDHDITDDKKQLNCMRTRLNTLIDDIMQLRSNSEAYIKTLNQIKVVATQIVSEAEQLRLKAAKDITITTNSKATLSLVTVEFCPKIFFFHVMQILLSFFFFDLLLSLLRKESF